MKRNILLAAMLLLAAVGMQAQVIVKHGEKQEKVEFGEDKLVKITFDNLVYINNYNELDCDDNIYFHRQSGDTLIFTMEEVRVMGFAADFTKVDEVAQAGKTVIAYDAAECMVHIVNAAEGGGDIVIYTAEGKPVKRGQGIALSVGDLDAGLYIVNYNKELNAKIVKK